MISARPSTAKARTITHGAVVDRLSLEGLVVTDARHEPGTKLALHAHPRACLTLVVAGAFEEGLEGDRYWCTRGHVVLKPAETAHWNQYGHAESRSFVVELDDSDPSFAGRTRELFDGPKVFEDGPLAGGVRRLREACHEPDLETHHEVRELLRALPGLAAGTVSAPPPVPDRGVAPGWLRRVHDRVCDDVRNRPPIEVLATDAGVHPDHVCRAFRRYFGYTISDLVRRRRVEHAAQAIRTTDRPLSTIALEAGFSDQSHMTRQMNRYLGLTPGELRAG